MTYERVETLEFEVTYALRRLDDGDAEIMIARISGDGGEFHHPDMGADEVHGDDTPIEDWDDALVYDTLHAGSWDDTVSDDEVLRRYFESSYGAA